MQTYTNEIANSALSLLALIVIRLLFVLEPHVVAFFKAHTTNKQRSTLRLIAQEAVSFSREAFKEFNGDTKMKGAISFADNKLRNMGMPFTVEEIQAAIQTEYDLYKASTTQPAPAEPKTITVDKPLDPAVQALVDAAKAVAVAKPSDSTETASAAPAQS